MRPPAKRLGGEIPLMGSNPIPSAVLIRRMKVNKYFTWTIGCQMNVADTEKLESAMNLMGLDNTDDVHDADVVVVNSCVVRSSAEDKVT